MIRKRVQLLIPVSMDAGEAQALIDANSPKVAGPFFLRHKVRSHCVDVELVRADDAVEGLTAPKAERLGYWKDDSKDVERVLNVHGPFNTREEALLSEKAWVEDV